MNSQILSELSSVTPGGSQTLSKQANRYPANYPKGLYHGCGGRVYDLDGKEYIDLISGLGAISVGYCNPKVDLKVMAQLRDGVSFSLPTVVEWEAARKLTELVPGTDMWKFGKTGTDGVLMAVRAARAFTGRKEILTFGYHGCTDHFECLGTRQAGMIDMRSWTHPWEYMKTLTRYAAVVLEPWMLTQTITKEIREYCNKYGTLLIADEVVTGGRFEGFTASSYIKVVPDLYVLGKGLANGFPLCAVGGTRRIMSTFERDDFFASGTFNGETVSLAAFLATQKILTEKIPTMVKHGKDIQDWFNQQFAGLASCVGYPTRLDFQFLNKNDKYKFWQEMCKREVLIGYNNFIMADHTNEDVDKIKDAIYDVRTNFDKVELEGPIPSEALKRG
jgi:glutamate-1-semialdehyde aminotransferase